MSIIKKRKRLKQNVEIFFFLGLILFPCAGCPKWCAFLKADWQVPAAIREHVRGVGGGGLLKGFALRFMFTLTG